ncbi:MAG: L-lactate dehydrogenase [Hyphomonadaceae bacterium]|nr:L-lactate dehydrogenase [Hyphomonadaceae bacterium]
MKTAASISDYRELARRRLPHFLFEYIDGGAYAEVTLKRNESDLEALALRQRVLRDVSKIDLSTNLFGQNLAMPVALGPVGLAGMFARRGETQALRAAERAGVPFCLSTVSVCSLSEVAAAAAKPFWFQLYMVRDRAFMRDLLAIARELGCPTLVFTVDLPTPGARYRDARSGMGQAGLRRLMQVVSRPHWAWDVGVNGKPLQLGNVAPLLGPRSGLGDFLGWVRDNFDASVTWKDLEWLRNEWRGQIVIKGVLEADDARAAAEAGADGIVASNHGGRQLDGAISAVRALPPIVDAVGDRLTVLADGGVRSGLDVVRMLALGARGVLLGRAWAYALGGAGERGVAHMLALMRAEMQVAMALSGVTKVAEIDRSALVEG